MKKLTGLIGSLLLGTLAPFVCVAEKGVWLEAEGFRTLGGWVVDQQSMGQMGSAYIMAHGMGVPIENAQTVCNIPRKGEWTVWVRTRDWTASWKRGTPAGRFQILVNGQLLPAVLGTKGAAWDWQKAGVVGLEKGETKIALHDLTGFNGRCDAVFLTDDAALVPPDDAEKLTALRRQETGVKVKDDPVIYDLAIAGGGMAGTCAAVAAIRTGCKVVLIQDRPVLGGCNSSEVRVGLGGWAQWEPYPNVGKIVTAIGPIMGGGGVYPGDWYEDKRKETVFHLTPGNQYKLALNERVFAVEKDPADPKTITAYIARNARTGAETRYRARLFADCTGDAVIARLMGAEVMYGREAREQFNESIAPVKADRQVMGMSVQWISRQAPEPTAFPDIDWGLPFSEDTVCYIRSGNWSWETGQYRNQVDEAEYIRDYGLMAILGNWSFLKNHSKRKAEWSRDTLDWVSAIGGKRESYRVVGDLIINQNDLEQNRVYPDATVSITWDLDHHFPDPSHLQHFQEPFRSCAYHRGFMKPYPVPYRCLYARDVKNLFLGGRHISVSHSAFSAVRVMRTLGSLGEVIGMAATVCKNENVYPRDVYTTHFGKLKALMQKGVDIKPYHAYSTGGMEEKYHFYDLGFLSVNDEERKKKTTPDIEKDYQERIKALNIQHRNAERR
ncbi:MAG: FAD-dependent oxidoreductase [Kiritimatiellae bacterium]|nr:FAD-dependent oxidoreductase [Kiritimatiellia bacterium]